MRQGSNLGLPCWGKEPHLPDSDARGVVDSRIFRDPFTMVCIGHGDLGEASTTHNRR